MNILSKFRSTNTFPDLFGEARNKFANYITDNCLSLHWHLIRVFFIVGQHYWTQLQLGQCLGWRYMKVQDNLYIYIYIYSNLGSKVAFSPAQSGQILRLIHTGEHKFRHPGQTTYSVNELFLCCLNSDVTFTVARLCRQALRPAHMSGYDWQTWVRKMGN